MKYCTNCGAQMPDDALSCTNCGTPLQASQIPKQPDQEFNASQQPNYSQPNQPPFNQQAGYVQIGNNQVNSKALIAMILGIGGLVFVIIAPFLANFPALIGLVLSIIGIIFGVKARNELPVGYPGRSMATAGLVCAIIGTVIGSIATLCTVCVCSCATCLAVGAANSDSSWLSNYSDFLTILFR